MVGSSKSPRFILHKNFQFCWYQQIVHKYPENNLLRHKKWNYVSTPFRKLSDNTAQAKQICRFSLKKCWGQQNMRDLVHKFSIFQTLTYQGTIFLSFMSLALIQHFLNWGRRSFFAPLQSLGASKRPTLKRVNAVKVSNEIVEGFLVCETKPWFAYLFLSVFIYILFHVVRNIQ